MNPIYYATMALTALSLTAGDAEAKRRRKADTPEPVSAIVHLTTKDEDRLLAQIYSAQYQVLEAEGKKVQRDYNLRINNCGSALMSLDFCDRKRVGELERAVAVHQSALDEWTLDYSIVLGLSPEKKKELDPLLVRYKKECSGKSSTTYCLEFGADIFERGTELSTPPEPVEERTQTRT